jgi:hypothetical protein
VHPKPRPLDKVNLRRTRNVIYNLEDKQAKQLQERQDARRALKRAFAIQISDYRSYRAIEKQVNTFARKNRRLGESEANWVDRMSQGELDFIRQLKIEYLDDIHIGPEVERYDDACRALWEIVRELDDLEELERTLLRGERGLPMRR